MTHSKRLAVLLFGLAALALTQCADTIASNPVVANRTVIGFWEGSVVTTDRNRQYEPVPLSMRFVDQHRVAISMRSVEDAAYEVVGDSIQVHLRRPGESLIFRDVRIDADTLSANLTNATDPPDIVSIVRLTKTMGKPLRAVSKTGSCSKPDIPRDVQLILNEYDLECPIAIPPPSEWFERDTIATALSEVLRNRGLLSSDAESVPLNVYPQRDGFVTYVFGGKAKAAVDQLISPLLQDPRQFRIEDCSGCMLLAPALGEIRPDFIVNGTVNFDRLWQAILTAPERIPGVRINLATEKTTANGKSVETYFRRLDLSNGFVVGEQTEISMIVPAQPARSNVEISVTAQLRKRRISDYRWIKIDTYNIARSRNYREYGPAMEALTSYNIENPYVQAITRAIVR